MVFLHALEGIFSLLVVVVVGYILAWRGWFTPQNQILLPKIVTCVSLPPFLMTTIVQSMDHDNLLHMIYSMLLPFTAIALTFILAWVVGKLCNIRKDHFGLFCSCVSNSNTIFVGIPVNLALFGPQSLPYALLYYFAATIFFWTIGHAVIRNDRPHLHKARLLDVLAHFFSPSMLGFLIGIGIVLCNIHVPHFLLEPLQLIGNLTTPLALLFIGVSLHNMDLRHLAYDRDLFIALGGRLIISPLITYTLLYLLVPYFPIPSLMSKVFVMQSALPVLTQAAILSAYYQTDPKFGALAVSLSTLLSVITIPVCMVLL